MNECKKVNFWQVFLFGELKLEEEYEKEEEKCMPSNKKDGLRIEEFEIKKMEKKK